MPRSRKPSPLSILAQHWKRLLMVGVLDVIAGVVSLALPGATLVAPTPCSWALHCCSLSPASAS